MWQQYSASVGYPQKRDHALMMGIRGLDLGGQKGAHRKAWWKGRVKGQEEQRATWAATARSLPEALSTLVGAHLTPCLFTLIPRPQDLRLPCTLHRRLQHGPRGPSEAAWEVLERACHPTPLRPPEGLLCL